ncbi:MAG TPA: hypothetical protein VLE44_03340 [Candidatus Saccharimonadales bacterium]|nr:hypothetical protein [Candidatus Saccharimonadales bacterium]
MPEVSVNPGHSHGLRELGILEENESGLEAAELIKRSLEKKVVLPVIHILQQEVGNSTFPYIDEFVMDSNDLLKTRMDRKEDLERLQDNVVSIGRAIYSAMVHIPLIEDCGTELLNQAKEINLLNESEQKRAENFLKQINDIRKDADKMIDEKGDLYIDQFERLKKELLARGGSVADIFDI